MHIYSRYDFVVSIAIYLTDEKALIADPSPVLSGTPELKFFKGMASKHCDKACGNHKFEASNYQISTTSATEWAIVVGGEKPDVGQMKAGRRIPCVEDLLQLPITTKAKLTDFEVAALVLYTGPMVRSATHLHTNKP